MNSGIEMDNILDCYVRSLRVESMTDLLVLDRDRKITKAVFNEQFGSLFRTYHNPTYFSRRLFRFADVYTSKVTNLLRFSPKHTFYARRGALPHEYRSWFVWPWTAKALFYDWVLCDYVSFF